ncbi:hypothetical protein [Vallicoccus soli]|uniref:Uncharacterized protein n=1 Tax=Vallicoccus soli TaxID=2339232 RepID=A0A3A3YVN7_9ACTN|nr:hypothetical protein [Vallicoccus soli]RJK94757.1 hypothetical protein D5H78_13040 [Vallicoccus soli]
MKRLLVAGSLLLGVLVLCVSPAAADHDGFPHADARFALTDVTWDDRSRLRLRGEGRCSTTESGVLHGAVRHAVTTHNNFLRYPELPSPEVLEFRTSYTAPAQFRCDDVHRSVEVVFPDPGLLAGTRVGLHTEVRIGQVMLEVHQPHLQIPLRSGLARCVLRAELPRALPIDGIDRNVPVALTNTCYESSVTSFDIHAPVGGTWHRLHYSDLRHPEKRQIDVWPVRSTDLRLGSYRSSLWANRGYLALHESHTVVKYGSKTSLSARRAGERVELRACLAHYRPPARRFSPWRGARVTLQQQRRDGTWKYVKTAATDDVGCTRVPHLNRYAGTYRAVAWETDRVFGRTSSNVLR